MIVTVVVVVVVVLIVMIAIFVQNSSVKNDKVTKEIRSGEK